MYNLMVTAEDNAWEEGAYIWGKLRILEFTGDGLKEQFRMFSEQALARLAEFPTLFMYEQSSEGTVRVGRIRKIQPRGDDIRVIFDFDDSVPELNLEQIADLKWDLDIRDREFSRTHWAVKDIDLYAVLEEAGLYTQNADTEEEPGTTQTPVVQFPGRIFIVHGRAEPDRVARFLETKVGLDVCILHEQPNLGRTIITKFQEEASDALFAVVLMTPDDMGHLRHEYAGGTEHVPQPRARQNVIMELGFFLGKLGANKVCVLMGENVEKPSDYDGVVYIPFDNEDGWKRKLVLELQSANIPVSQNWWQ